MRDSKVDNMSYSHNVVLDHGTNTIKAGFSTQVSTISCRKINKF